MTSEQSLFTVFYPEIDASRRGEESSEEQLVLVCSQCLAPAFFGLVFILFLHKKLTLSATIHILEQDPVQIL